MNEIMIDRQDFIDAANAMREWMLGDKRGEGYDCRCVVAYKLRKCGYPNAAVDGQIFWLSYMQRAVLNSTGAYIMEVFDRLDFTEQNDDHFAENVVMKMAQLKLPAEVTWELQEER